MPKPELLAPAGDYKSAIAAVEAGADAVYFGGKNFSARNLAANLSYEEIGKAIDYAHLRGVKCYATANTLVKNSEFKNLFDFINFLYAQGIDALIIQDLGVYNLCRKYFPDLPLHASTQMTAHNLNDVMILEKMGFKRVVLARELTLEEIREIKNKVKIELECFIHGALCFSYSGQCFMSSMLGGRSGNRGRCAQPCRKKYILADRLENKNLGENGYLLSARDLCALEILDKLQFIDSLKIEGRMKSAEYVGGVTAAYRKNIDALEKSEKINASEDKKELAAIFNRGGFCTGYYLKQKPPNLIAKERSKNFGVKVGEVVEIKKDLVKIKAENTKVNDGLEIWGRGGQEKNTGFSVSKISDCLIQVRLRGDIKKGDPVYKTFDYGLNKNLSKWSKENRFRKAPLSMIFEARIGKNIVLRINDVRVEGEKISQALKISTSEKMVKDQLAKLGGTPFSAKDITVKMDDNLNIPFKNINNLRQKGIAKLEKTIINSFKRKEKGYARESNRPKTVFDAEKRICIQSDNPGVLNSLPEKKIFRIYTSLPVDLEKFHKNGIEVFQAFPKIFRQGEKVEIFSGYDGFLVPSLGYLNILPREKRKISDYSLNIFNNGAIAEMENLGFSEFTASLENTLEEINALDQRGLEKEVVVYGHLPIMTSEHCALFKTAYCRNKGMGIKDEKRTTFPILADCANCRMQILNSMPLYFTEIERLASDNIRLIHTIETPEKFLDRLDSYLDENFTDKKSTTTGHFYHGVE